MADKKIGILACSGEECLGGTISRLATRRVMEKLRPNRAVTLCLPLYIAGGEEERSFAKEYPVNELMIMLRSGATNVMYTEFLNRMPMRPLFHAPG